MHEYIARLTLKDVPAMTSAGRSNVANWLRALADTLEYDGDELADKFTARYIYAQQN